MTENKPKVETNPVVTPAETDRSWFDRAVGASATIGAFVTSTALTASGVAMEAMAFVARHAPEVVVILPESAKMNPLHITPDIIDPNLLPLLEAGGIVALIGAGISFGIGMARVLQSEYRKHE